MRSNTGGGSHRRNDQIRQAPKLASSSREGHRYQTPMMTSAISDSATDSPGRVLAAAEEREESKQAEQEGDHRAGTVAGSEPTDQPLARRTEFWRRTGCRGFFRR